MHRRWYAFRIGEKTWSPWENGRNRPSRSINLLLRALDDGKITTDYLKAVATPPAIWETDAFYMSLDELFQVPHTACATDVAAGEEQFELVA